MYEGPRYDPLKPKKEKVYVTCVLQGPTERQDDHSPSGRMYESSRQPRRLLVRGSWERDIALDLAVLGSPVTIF